MIPIFDKNNENLKYSDQLQEIMNNLVSYPNVHTVYRGKKTTNGQVTDTDCLVVHVSKKINAEDLDPNDIIPSIVGESILTDIIESAQPEMALSCYEAGTSSCYNDPKSFYDPLVGGISFGVSGTCTLGAIVKDATDNTIVALSNNHCAGLLYDPAFGDYTNASTNTVGLLARQPSTTDAGETTPVTFGSVKRAVPFKLNMTGSNTPIIGGPTNSIDAAICSIDISGSPDIGMLNIAENIPLKFVESSEIDSYIGSVVRKNGRTSCTTSGVVIDTNASCVSANGGTYTLFSNQVLIQSLPDRSPLSSIIYDDNNIYVVGQNIVVSSGILDTNWNIDYYKFNDNYIDDNINAVFFDLSDKLLSSPVLSYHINGNNNFLHMRSRLGPDAFSNPYNNTNIYTSIFTSTDAINWNMVYYSENKYYGLIYANSIYFAIGNNCYMTSSDGLIWNEQNNNSIPIFDSQINTIAKTIAYGNNKFIGIYPGNSPASSTFPGNSSIITYVSHTDTVTVSSPFSGSIFRAGAITYSNNMFVLLPDRPNDKIQISNDGNTWTQISVPFGYWYSLAYGNGKFVAVRSNSVNSNSDQVMYSSDGINWTSIQPSSTIYSWLAIEYVDDMFFASSSEGAIMTSTDGISWTFARVPEIANKTYQMGGDSGSVTLTHDNKILCLNHSAAPAINDGCYYRDPALCYGARIHRVAEALQIKPWQGEIVVEKSDNKTITVNGRTYVRYGMTNDPITHTRD